MKNITKRILMALGITLLTSVTIMANTKYILMVNNKKIDTKIIVENGVTYVPLRLVGEALDAEVKFENGVINVSSNAVAQNNGDDYPGLTSINLTTEEELLISDVKELFSKDIVIRNGEVREIKNGESYYSRTKEDWQIEVSNKKIDVKNLEKAKEIFLKSKKEWENQNSK